MRALRRRAILQVAGLLLRFFSRRVLGAGALRSRAVRWTAAGAVVVLASAMSVVAYEFLSPYASDPAVWELLLGGSTVSLLLWTGVAFLFVKVLFLSSDGILELTHQLPVTGRERAVAFVLFEVVITLSLACSTTVPVVVGAVALTGWSAVQIVLTSMLLPVLVAYLLLGLMHTVLIRALVAVRLRGLAAVIAVLAVFGLIAGYASQVGTLVSDVAGQGPGAFHWPLVIGWLATQVGLLTTLAGVAVVCGALVGLTVMLMPQQYASASRFLHLRLPVRAAGHLGPYDLCFVRSQHFVISAVVALATAVFLLLQTDAHPAWALPVLSIGGLYLFSATAPLRAASIRRDSPIRTYWATLRPQVLTMGVVAGPVLLLGAATGRADGGVAIVGALMSATLTACIGIVFPTERDNPLSALVGLTTTVVVLSLVALGVGLLRLPVAGAAGAVLVVLVLYAVLGVRTEEMRRRHEEPVDRRQRDRRRDAADPGARGRVVDGPDADHRSREHA